MFDEWRQQGYTADEVLAIRRAWDICPEPVEMLLGDHGANLYMDGKITNVHVNFGEDVALLDDGTPVILRVAQGLSFPLHETYNPDGIAEYRDAIIQNELALIHKEKPSRYALKELIFKACNSGVDITSAQAALGGREEELRTTIDSLKAAMEPAPELVRVPLSDSEQAFEGEITVRVFDAIRRGEEIDAPEPVVRYAPVEQPEPQPTFDEIQAAAEQMKELSRKAEK